MQRYLAIIGLFIIISSLILSGCGPDYAAEKRLWYANKLRSEKAKDQESMTAADYDEIISAYKQILSKYPDWSKNGGIQLNVARLYAAKKDFVRAEEEFKKTIENYPQDIASAIDAQIGIGSIYEERDEWEKAEVEYKKVAANFPHSSGNRLLLKTFEMPLYIARHYQMAKEEEKGRKAYEEAIADYQKVVDKNKDNELGAIAQSYIARAYMNQGNWEKAIEVFQTLIADYPQSSQSTSALYAIGGIYQEQLKLPAQAIEVYRKLIEGYPEGTNVKEAQFRIGQLYAQEENIPQAIKEVQLVLDKYPKDNQLSPIAQQFIGALYEQDNQWDKALLEYRKVMQDFPRTLPAFQVPLHILQYYKKNEDDNSEEVNKYYLEAIDYYKKEVSQNKGTALGLSATEFLVNTHFTQEEWDKGISILETISGNYPDIPQAQEALYTIGNIYQEQLKLPVRAIETYRKYIEGYPEGINVKDAQFRIGQLYAQEKNIPQAIKEVQLVLDKYPKDNQLSPIAQQFIGTLYEQDNQWDKALLEYRKVMQDFPRTLPALQMPMYILQYYKRNEDDNSEEVNKYYLEAIDYYKKEVSQSKGTALGLAATEFLARTYFTCEDSDKGIKILRQLTNDYPANNPRVVIALFLIADAYATNLKDGNKAIGIYKDIREKYSQPDIAAPALFHIGRVYQDILNQSEEAKEIYAQFLADYPEHTLAEKVKEALKTLDAE